MGTILTVNKIMTEPYQHEGALRANVSRGFASIRQKTKIEKLKILEDGKIKMGEQVVDFKKGDYVLVTEEMLHTAPWSKNVLTIDEKPCILVDPLHVIGFERKK